jgi:hypothetical protein
MEQGSQKQDSQKDMTKHMNEIKWILVCGFLVVMFFVSTEPVVPDAAIRIQSICADRDRLSAHNKFDCLIYEFTGRVLNPRVF